MKKLQNLVLIKRQEKKIINKKFKIFFHKINEIFIEENDQYYFLKTNNMLFSAFKKKININNLFLSNNTFIFLENNLFYLFEFLTKNIINKNIVLLSIQLEKNFFYFKYFNTFFTNFFNLKNNFSFTSYFLIFFNLILRILFFRFIILQFFFFISYNKFKFILNLLKYDHNKSMP